MGRGRMWGGCARVWVGAWAHWQQERRARSSAQQRATCRRPQQRSTPRAENPRTARGARSQALGLVRLLSFWLAAKPGCHPSFAGAFSTPTLPHPHPPPTTTAPATISPQQPCPSPAGRRKHGGEECEAAEGGEVAAGGVVEEHAVAGGRAQQRDVQEQHHVQACREIEMEWCRDGCDDFRMS